MSIPAATTLPLVLLEDDHLLAIDKPPGISTHAPSPFASEGIYEWLRRREPRWKTLSILHRLDKETSGVLLFGKTRQANQSLSAQFEQRTVNKRYVLLSDHDPGAQPRRITTPDPADRSDAATSFRRLSEENGRFLIEAVPHTGRTHQVRRHASEAGFPVLGDPRYGGSAFTRLCLHAHEIEFAHPVSGEQVRVDSSYDFAADHHLALRLALWPAPEFDAWRLIHGGSSGTPGWYVDRLGEYLLSQSEDPPSNDRQRRLETWRATLGLRAVYHKQLDRDRQRGGSEEVSPVLLSGEAAPPRFPVRENGVAYALSFAEGYSTGLFLDQRENRRLLLEGRVPGRDSLAGATVLNTFAYTSAFSVCAALAGATVTSLDLSRKVLDWGRENFVLNGLDLAAHDFIYGDCFDWMKRLANKRRRFDLILLDPPTFSRSKKSGTFRVEKHYGRLVEAALALLSADGSLFCSTNCATLSPETFLGTIRAAITGAGRSVVSEEFVAQPPDFATSAEEPPYLKTAWFGVGS